MIRDALSQCSQNVIANLPLRENLRKTIRRERRIGLPPNPKSLDELEDLPPKYQLSAKGEQFLLFDSRDDPDFGIGRVIVFSTRRNLEQLAKSDTWFVDGTFKVCPSIFTQLFTILGSVIQPNKGTDHSVLALPLSMRFFHQRIATIMSLYSVLFSPVQTNWVSQVANLSGLCPTSSLQSLEPATPFSLRLKQMVAFFTSGRMFTAGSSLINCSLIIPIPKTTPFEAIHTCF